MNIEELKNDIKESILADKQSLNKMYGNDILMNKAFFRSLMIVDDCFEKFILRNNNEAIKTT